MLKKIMLSVVVTAVLIGVSNLIAQERRDRPEARARQRQKDQAEQPRRQRAGGEAVREHSEQEQQQRAIKESRRDRESLRDEPQPVRPRQNQLAQPRQMFGRWLDELTKAYRADDRETMGQLLRKMHQLRQERQRVRDRGFQGRGMIGRWGRGLQRRDFTRPGLGMPQPPFMEKPEPPKDVDRPSPPMPPRGMGGWGRGFRGRGMGRSGPSMPPPPFMEKPEPDEDVDRPSPPMPPRGMGGWGRGFQRRGMGRWGIPSPWCPWLRFPRPETD